MASIFFASLCHSFLASLSSHFGQAGAFRSGFGSFSFSFLFPGFPSNSLIAVGVGFLPLVAIGNTSFLSVFVHQKKCFLFSVFFSVEVVQDGKERKLCVFRLRLDVPPSIVSCDREVSEANLKLADLAALNSVVLARLSVNLRAVGECLVLDLYASFVPHGFFLLVLFLFAFSYGMYIYHSARLI